MMLTHILANVDRGISDALIRSLDIEKTGVTLIFQSLCLLRFSPIDRETWGEIAAALQALVILSLREGQPHKSPPSPIDPPVAHVSG